MSEKVLDYSFEEKWTEAVTRHNFTQVPNILIKCQGHLHLNDGELMVLIHLISYWYHGKSRIFPSINTLAERSGKSYATIQKRLTPLESKGFIKKRKRFAKSNLYNIKPMIGLLARHSAKCDGYRKIVRVVRSEPTPPMASFPFKEEYEILRIPIEETYPEVDSMHKKLEPSFDEYLKETGRRG